MPTVPPAFVSVFAVKYVAAVCTFLRIKILGIFFIYYYVYQISMKSMQRFRRESERERETRQSYFGIYKFGLLNTL